MGLEEYRKKRNFSSSPEPKGETPQDSQQRFVVQRHQARRLHYDLRLEIDGVLKSWAVPRGPSMNPKDRRLAVETEDHPVNYLNFEGSIPKGNYGAGQMFIWDRGHYSLLEDENKLPKEQYREGNLKIYFEGQQLKGSFALVRTGMKADKPQWLLIKKKDEHATTRPYDAESISPPGAGLNPGELLKPMLATPAPSIFNDPAWIYEVKWDGYRVLAHLDGDSVALYSRNGRSYNRKFGKLREELTRIPHEAILDGEVVWVNSKGVPQFGKLQNYGPGNTGGTLRYYVFDMLYLNGHPMLQLPLTERKSLLPELLEGLEHVQYCEHVKGMGISFYKRVTERGMEGVIAKKADSAYHPGRRSENWLKIKAVQNADAVICGYTDSVKGGALFGSLILGVPHEGELRYAGNCGTGYSAEVQKELRKSLIKLETSRNPFGKKINLKGRTAHWVRPELICELKFSEITPSGMFRHAVFKRLKENDFRPKSPRKKPTSPSVSGQDFKEGGLSIGGIQVPLSNLEKVYWPESGLRKYDLIDYYLHISDFILPYLKDRPQNLHRHPDGIGKPGFYQKDNEHLPVWVEHTGIFSKSAGKTIEYMLCQNEASLLYMANLGCIEINPWNARIQHLDRPDYCVIDLDPSDTNTFEEVITTAQWCRELLSMAGIEGYCKTSGSRGLHIYIPLAAKYTDEEARAFTKLLCHFIQEQLPDLCSMERAVKNRKGKIYLDYLQNRRGQTLAAAYCVRPRSEAPVSAPLGWPEVKKGLRIQDFNLRNMKDRLSQAGDLFLPVLGKGISMEKAIRNLEKGSL